VANVLVPHPFDFGLTTERFRVFGPDLVTLWRDGGLHRVVAGREVRIEAAPGGVDVEPLDDEVAAVVLKLLGAEFDLAAFEPDPLLAQHVSRLRGYRPALAPEPFELLVGAITAQQISLKAATSIRNRFVERFGVRAEHAYAFPAREAVASASAEDLTRLGFSRSKARAVLELARSELDLAGLAALPDEEVRAALTRLPGIGEWTADWYLARHLARPRAWPAGDLALRYAASAFYGDGRVLTIQETRELGARFEPFQNLTAHYLLMASRNPG
jgi:DNA-3-methyladenine glycosylase II